MQKGKVYRNKTFAGLLIKISSEEYIFQYDKDYLEKDNAKAISLNFPLQEKEFKSNYMFAFFFNMLAEGSMKDLQCKQLRIDKDDNFSRLLKTTNMNTIGSITLEEIINE